MNNMLNVGILFDANYNGITYQYTLYPLVIWARELERIGVKIWFFTDTRNKRLYDCDSVIVLSSYFGNTLTLKNEQIEILSCLKKCIPKLIFFDITDSCGTTKFESLEIVDLYLKRQMYKDKSLYEKHLYGTRSFCDFYLRNFGTIKRDCFEKCTLLQKEYVHKLRIGWNIGIGNYLTKNKIFKNHNSWYCNNYLRVGHVIDRLCFPNDSSMPHWSKKEFDITYRGSLKYSIDAISFSRNKINEILDQNTIKYLIKYRDKIRHDLFVNELRKSKIVISPFGYGEICFRDFEAFHSNSCLLKPDMSHLETWPNFYEDESTYISYRWDFSNVMEKIENALTGNTAQQIAQYGYEMLLNTNSEEGAVGFCTRFHSLVT